MVIGKWWQSTNGMCYINWFIIIVIESIDIELERPLERWEGFKEETTLEEEEEDHLPGVAVIMPMGVGLPIKEVHPIQIKLKRHLM